MQYLFRGLRRGVGEPVTGRITAPNEDAVHRVLESHAIAVDTLGPEDAGGLFPPTLDAALEAASVRITFDQMARVHEGHGVWTLDQDRIRSRVMQLARGTLGDDEAGQAGRRRIEQALERLYGEKHDAAATAEPTLVDGNFADADEVRAEIQRLMAAIKKLERELTSMRSRPAATRAQHRIVTGSTPHDRTQAEVLREIFEHNLELMKLTQAQEHGANGEEGPPTSPGTTGA